MVVFLFIELLYKVRLTVFIHLLRVLMRFKGFYYLFLALKHIKISLSFDNNQQIKLTNSQTLIGF